MLAGGRAAVPDDEVVDFRRKFHDYLFCFGALEVHERNDMEIPISDMSRHRIDHLVFVLIEKCIEFRKELRIAFRRNDEVVDEGRGIEAGEILSKQSEALAPHYPKL